MALRRTCRCTEFHRVKNANLRHPSANVLILSSHFRLALPIGLLPSCYPAKFLYALTSLFVPNTPPISFFLIWSYECLVRSTDHEAPRHAFPSIPIRPPPQHPILEHTLSPCSSLSTLFSNIPSALVLPSAPYSRTHPQPLFFPQQAELQFLVF